MCSERVSVHLTARLTLREIQEARISSGYCGDLHAEAAADVRAR